MNQGHTDRHPEQAHRPTDRAQLAIAAHRLANEGLTHYDIAGALRLSEAAVAQLLNEPYTAAAVAPDIRHKLKARLPLDAA